MFFSNLGIISGPVSENLGIIFKPIDDLAGLKILQG